ncbi:hypothetical protein HYDPIDRAFT_83283 [Hydnomerulius pinastri MD-312]|nr:hypothetical protein HYDPIDRAFT_83283 [Hydnomerulius pinastri MD-312]
MALVTTLIDDKSPLLQYDATWSPGTSADSYADEYYLGTFTTSNVTGGTASFSFNGTAFWIYGAKRDNHGTFSVSVNGQTYANNNGYANPYTFQQVLFNTSGLAQGTHQVLITNTGTNNQYVDIDLVVWQSETSPASGSSIETKTIQDTDPNFQYEAPAWNANPPNVNFFNNGTGHSTTSYNATATFSFTVSDAVALYGTVGPQNGPYAVSIDGGAPANFNATTFLSYPQTMLFYASNLGFAPHVLTITNLPDSNGQYLNIDFAQVTTLASTR